MRTTPRPLHVALMATVLAGAAPTPDAYAARPICDEITEMTTCGQWGGCYAANWKNGDAPTETGVCSRQFPTVVEVKFINPDPPGVGVLHCQISQNEVSCDAWPRGAGFTYQWSRTGAVFFGGSVPSWQSDVTLNCPNPNGGTIHAKVYSPSGTHVTTQNFYVPPGACFPY